MKGKYVYGLLMLVIFITSCKKAFLPNVVSSDNSYLVVEGIINSGGDTTVIKLSKTVKVAAAEQVVGFDGCTVTVEDEQSNAFPLHGAGNGKYTSPHVPIDTTKAYRLHIVTGNGKEYASDYVKVKPTPAIDDIQYDSVKYNGDDSKYVQLYVNTHDDTGNSRYYRWDFTETWQIMSFFESFYIVDKSNVNEQIRPRTDEEQANVCYKSEDSGNIYIGSSAKLDQDVIYRNPIGVIPHGSEKLKYRYSILVRQYALSKDEYQFWDNIQKNTEKLGSIFDAQPSQISGNIHNIKDANEPVIGYVSITNVQTKRIFINSGDVPTNGLSAYPFPNCKLDLAEYDPYPPYGPEGCSYCLPPTGEVLSILVNGGGLFEPTTPVPLPPPDNSPPKVKGWRYSSLECVDCRLRGTNKKPSFWID